MRRASLGDIPVAAELRYKVANSTIGLEGNTLMAVATATQPGPKHNVQVARQAYYDKAAKFHMAPLWEVLKDLVTPEPKTQCQPAIWKFSDVISTEEAERRVLVLENPGQTGKSRVTNSLFAGIQLILPGEIADVHRHSASAIRFVLEGEGAYTAVEGEIGRASCRERR